MNINSDLILYSDQITDIKDYLNALKKENMELHDYSNYSIEQKQCISSISELSDIIMEKLNNLSISSSDSILHDKRYEINFKLNDVRVLIADDSKINNYILSEMLKRFNIDIDIALTGDEAIRLYNENEYDIVFVDYVFPEGIDGAELVRKIRKTKNGSNQLIIGITSSDSSVFKDEHNKEIVEIILKKPVKYDQLAYILQKELKEKALSISD